MKREYSISVALASFNGEKYIAKQLESILPQLAPSDEVVISDDGSTDGTLEIARNIKDKRIKIFERPKNGVKQNFGNAISKCSGKYIFLADQDDIWLPDKVSEVLKVFESQKCKCVVHDAEVFDSETNKIVIKSFFKWRGSRAGIWKNIWKNSYIGCCMAFNASMKEYILPIPNDIEMHDQWIGVLCEKYGKSVFLDKVLLRYRRHSENQTKMNHYGIKKMLSNRTVFIKRMGSK